MASSPHETTAAPYHLAIFTAIVACLTMSLSTASFAETITREGTHLRLTSDVNDARLLDDFVDSFDAAVPQWLAFWGLPVARCENWKIDGFLMQDADAFRRSGALPGNLPTFKNGFATPTAIWVHFQKSDYYNRHLILHEGVHALCFELFGGGGPSWYMEGTAELLATHRDRSHATPGAEAGLLAQVAGGFRINELPANRDESPMWGRYRVVQERRDAATLPTLDSVLKLPTDLSGDVDTYTWCWAAAMMFTAYPDTRNAYVSAAQRGRDSSPAFTTHFYRAVGSEWPALQARWQVWLDDLEYGFDRERSRVNLSTDDPRYDGRQRMLNIDADKGWQSAGTWFPTGTIQIRAEGQCVIVAKDSLQNNPDNTMLVRDWTSTPAGITAHYHRGFPIGQLQVCVLPIPGRETKEVTPLEIQSPFPSSILPTDTSSDTLGRPTTIRIDRPSWLLFRVHDAPGDSGLFNRADNSGRYQVLISTP
jgi:hypothetical protein